jgi:acyl dehydratase
VTGPPADRADLVDLAGTDLGHSAWQTVDRQRILDFARITGDEQWIHVDEQRAVSGPYGAIVAHGMLTLSLVPAMVLALLPHPAGVVVHRGFRKVDFRSPVRVGARVRGAVRVTQVRPRPKDFWELLVDVSVQIDGSSQPALRTELILLCQPEQQN